MQDFASQIGRLITDLISAVIGAVQTALAGLIDALRASPGGFGLILIPLAILGFITFLVAYRR